MAQGLLIWMLNLGGNKEKHQLQAEDIRFVCGICINCTQRKHGGESCPSSSFICDTNLRMFMALSIGSLHCKFLSEFNFL
jgi:hypothetical protein